MKITKILALIGSITLITLGIVAYLKISAFFSHNAIRWQSPIVTPVYAQSKDQWIIEKLNAKPALPEYGLKSAYLDYQSNLRPILKPSDKIETPSDVEAYITQIFGKDARLALAVSQAENGTRQCDRMSKPNSNGTTDFGIFQINTIHLKKGWKLTDLLDCKANIEKAKTIYDGSGWNAWSAYKNGAYQKFIN